MINKFTFFLLVIFFILFFNKKIDAYSKHNTNNNARIFYRLKYYKTALENLYKNTIQKKSDIKKIIVKLKRLENKIKSLKDKINKDKLITGKLIRRIFMLQEESNLNRENQINKNINYVIINYELKSIINHEENKFNVLIDKKNHYNRIKNYLMVLKKSLKDSIKRLRMSDISLKKLIIRTENYINYIKISKNKKQNKKSRFLKKKVIKLIHKIKKNTNHSNNNPNIKFFVLK